MTLKTTDEKLTPNPDNVENDQEKTSILGDDLVSDLEKTFSGMTQGNESGNNEEVTNDQNESKEQVTTNPSKEGKTTPSEGAEHQQKTKGAGKSSTPMRKLPGIKDSNETYLEKWSRIIENIPEENRMMLIKNIGEAIQKSEIIAVSLPEELKLTYVGTNGRKYILTMQDEAIQVDEKFKQWMSRMLQENEYEMLERRQDAFPEFERLLNGELDFARLHKMRLTRRTKKEPREAKTGQKRKGKTSTSKDKT